DQNGGQRISLAESRCAIHRAIKFGFASDEFAAGTRLLFVDDPCVKVGVDSHLFAGPSIPSKTGSDFRSAHCAMMDDEILDCDESKKNHEANDVVSADNELAEGLNDAPRGCSTFCAVKQDAAAAGNVQRDAEQS